MVTKARRTSQGNPALRTKKNRPLGIDLALRSGLPFGPRPRRSDGLQIRRGVANASDLENLIGLTVGSKNLHGVCNTCGVPRPERTRCKPCRSVYLSRWYAANPAQRARLAANKRRYKTEDPIRFAEQVHRYKTSERGRFLGVRDFHTRRARILGNPGTWTEHDIFLLRLLQDGRCAMCGLRKKLTVDHIVPASVGGSNAPDNLQLLCLQCNSSKGIKAMSGIGYKQVKQEYAYAD